MESFDLYRDIAERTGGDIYIGGDVIISVSPKSLENRGLWWSSPIITLDGEYPASLKKDKLKNYSERITPKKQEVFVWVKQSRCQTWKEASVKR